MSTGTPPGVLIRPAFRSLDPTKILIVDNNAAQADVLRRRLTQQQYEVLIATSGAQARVLARRQRPDLILLDARLADASSLELCQEWTEAPSTCRIPVILLSAADERDLNQQSRAVGGEYIIRKPVDPNALLTLVRHALQASRTWPRRRTRQNAMVSSP